MPEYNEAGDPLAFYLSPNDLMYMPTEDEKLNYEIADVEQLTNGQLKQVYKCVSFTANRLYAIPNNVASTIIDKIEFTQLNKLEVSLDKQSIKEHCWKLQVDRLGKVIKVIRG